MFQARRIYRSKDGATSLKGERSLGNPWAGRPAISCITLFFTLPMRECVRTKLQLAGHLSQAPAVGQLYHRDPRHPPLTCGMSLRNRRRPGKSGISTGQKNAQRGHRPLLDNYNLHWSPKLGREPLQKSALH